ncbi:MAG TPA: Holliday junction branch migration protein RuvA [Actinobacteria bacterium]|nr:Holliday junction branch migration protein RuvA [Actinomycetota bacterium]
MLVSRGLEGAVVDVGGIGYEVSMTPRELAELPRVGDDVVVHTHLHVREEQLALFGFGTGAGRDLFRILLSASGVGPSLALSMMGAMQPDELRRAVAAEDVDLLVTIPGIGKRTAQKLILELGPKLGDPDAAMVAGGKLGQVREALEGLGYAPAEIREVAREIPDDAPLEEQVRAALRALGTG